MGQGSGSFTVSHLHNIASRRKGRKINSEHTASVRQPFSSFVRQYSESVLNCKLLKMILMWKWTPQTIFITMPIIELKVCLGGNAKYSTKDSGTFSLETSAKFWNTTFLTGRLHREAFYDGLDLPAPRPQRGMTPGNGGIQFL